MLSPSSGSSNLPTNPNAFWSKLKPKPKAPETKEDPMAVSRPRLCTLAFGEMETLRMMPPTFAELMNVAQEWTKPPPDAVFNLRIPVEYASMAAARLVTGPYIYLTGEDSYQIAIMGSYGTRVEIVSDGPPPVEEPQPPPPPPVLEMPGTFNLELNPGQFASLDVSINSDELDMSRMEDGTLVDGSFWGKLDIVHSGDTHTLEFSGSRLPSADYPQDLLVDSKVLTKLTRVAKPAAARCHLTILAPGQAYCDVVLTFSQVWSLGIAWPPPEQLEDRKVKYFLRVNPGGALEHFESQLVTTALYYEAVPDAAMMTDPAAFISPRNGFGMSYRDFVPHLMHVLDQLGLSMHARTSFINNNITAFSAHKNIAYRFLSPSRIASAVDITVTVDHCVFTRIFLIFRGLTEEEVGAFTEAGAGEKEGNQHNWREVVGWSENSKDPEMFRVLETSVLEIA